MIVFEKPDGFRIAVDSFDMISINELHPGKCSIVFNGLNMAEHPEGLVVIGNFEDLLETTRDFDEDEPWKNSL